MLTDLRSSDILVTCSCGARTEVASGWMVDSIVCNMCGCRVPLTEHNVRAKCETQSAIFQRAKHGDTAHKMRMSARFVVEGKLEEAEVLYREVLSEQPKHRDALYGLGYIAYKQGKLREALGFLRESLRLGHPTALRLIRRVSERLGALDSAP
jgi:tetratricopeptide (TPR) repeat protein